MNMEKLDWRVVLAFATVAMLIQQAFSYVCQMTLPILADRVAEDFGISRAWLGLYLFLQNLTAIVAAMSCGGFIIRFGALRVSQACLILMGGSLFVVAGGFVWLYPLGAILLGAGAVSTPASSHILSRFCPRHIAPVVFSVKQTGVPVGSLIGGLMIPALLGTGFYVAFLGGSIHLDAFGTAFVTGLIVYSVALALEPFRSHFDSDRNPTEKLSISGVSETLKLVLSNPKLRDIAFGGFAFGGLQSIFSGFFILYLIDGLDFTEADAGFLFAVASLSAVVARILWGWVGSSLLPARFVLGMIGAFGALAAVLTGLYDTAWSHAAILAVAVLYNITGLSWHGLLLAEVAALAPPGRVGGVTGATLSFTSVAMMTYPAIYGGILAVTDSYSLGFFFAAMPSALAAVIFFSPPVQGTWLRIVLDTLSWCLQPARLVYAGIIVLTGTALGAAMAFRALL
jgi:hypothetical protein